MKYYLAPDSAVHSATFSAPYSKIWKISVLASSFTIINRANIFTKKKKITPLLHFRKKYRSPSQQFLETLFTIFLLDFTVGEVCNISNKY